jgi:hypothetical protein
MTQDLIILGIQATLRAAQAGADLFSEHAKDRKILLTKHNLSDGPKSVQLQIFLTENSPNKEEFPNPSKIWDSEDKILRDFYYLYQ